MKFKKGQSGNPSGRPKKIQGTSLKNKIEKLLEKNFDQIATDLKQAEPNTRLRYWIRLLDFIERPDDTLTIERLLIMTSDERKAAINKLKERIQKKK